MTEPAGGFNGNGEGAGGVVVGVARVYERFFGFMSVFQDL
ncbi:hypothetical protein NCCP2716_17540 [Sporosarcina sp. NCCP-2716]|nr:hypothetical protein NCCP2716_17540 [Sporosarcina sp. NCCP-2716]